MKTYKFHVKIIKNDITICELQFERKVTAEMWARTAAKGYVRSLGFPKDSWINIPWMEEVADDHEEVKKPRKSVAMTKEGIKIFNELQALVDNVEPDSFCCRNQINSDGFFNWECPKMSIDEIIELKMESIEEVRND